MVQTNIDVDDFIYSFVRDRFL